VGKTWLTAQLVGVLARRGVRAVARKLAQSFAPEDEPAGRDAAVLGAASGEPAEVVCPPHRWYPAVMAPPMAAAALRRAPFAVADLLSELRWPGPAAPGTGGVTVGFLETAGGVRSPQADDGDVGTVAGLVEPDLVVVVVGAGLGAINDAVLASDALRGAVPTLAVGSLVVVLNRFDPDVAVHRANRRWLEDRAGLLVAAAPADLGALATSLRAGSFSRA
jgi:dethiobiotin synthetase